MPIEAQIQEQLKSLTSAVTLAQSAELELDRLAKRWRSVIEFAEAPENATIAQYLVLQYRLKNAEATFLRRRVRRIQDQIQRAFE
jgi:hypothetical protein